MPVHSNEDGSVDEQRVPRPTWETQERARTYQVQIPAPFTQSDEEVLAFAKQHITLVYKLLKRGIHLSEKEILRYYKKRSVLPLSIVEDLQPAEITVLSGIVIPRLVLRQRLIPGSIHMAAWRLV